MGNLVLEFAEGIAAVAQHIQLVALFQQPFNQLLHAQLGKQRVQPPVAEHLRRQILQFLRFQTVLHIQQIFVLVQQAAVDLGRPVRVIKDGLLDDQRLFHVLRMAVTGLIGIVLQKHLAHIKNNIADH